MVGVDLLFIFIASISFLGFIINSLFDKIKLTSIVPLLIIGLLVGPVFGIVNTGNNSIIKELTPFISALAVSFILFDAGVNIQMSKLAKVFRKATVFTLVCVVITGFAISLVMYFVLHFSLILSFIFGFAASGPGGIGIPMIMKVIKADEDLKTILIYESVASGVVALIVPLVLISVLLHGSASILSISSLVIELVFGSIAVGSLLALAWLFILNRFSEYSETYSWILTISMVLATYAIAQYLDFNGAIAVFIFGIIFGAIGSNIEHSNMGKHRFARYFEAPYDLIHIRNYQKEIVFFASTFFFVFMGLLFQKSGVTLFSVVALVLVSIMIIPIRRVLSRLLKDFMGNTDRSRKIAHTLISYSMLRDLSPAIIVTVVAAYGLSNSSFVNDMFILLLVTNIVSAIGIMVGYRKVGQEIPEVMPS